MLHLQGGRAMKRIATKFEQLGYRWAYRVLNTETFGLPQRRHRVYFLASRAGDPRDVLLSNDEPFRSEEHTSQLQSLMRISYAVFCLKKKKIIITVKEINTVTT